MKKLKSMTIMVTFLAVFCVSPVFAEKSLTLVSCEWPPYGGEKIEGKGFGCEIIKEAFKRSGYSVDFVFLPWARALMETEEGKYPGLFNAYLNEERSSKFAPSDPYIESTILFCAQNDFPKNTYSSLKDLSVYSIGLVRGYDNSPDIDNADYLKKDLANGDQMNLNKLLNKRVDLIVIDKFAALSEIKTNKYAGSSDTSIKFLSPPVATKPVHVLFSKKTADYQKIVEAFNNGLKETIADGTVKKIMEKHGLLVDKGL